MSCDNKKGVNIKQYVNIAELEPQPITDMDVVLGLDSCKNMVIAEVPPFEKLDYLIVDGDTDKALFEDGVYKQVYLKFEMDSFLDSIDNYLLDLNNEKVDEVVYEVDIENLNTDIENEIQNRINADAVLQSQINNKADNTYVTNAINDLQEQINEVPDIQEVLELKGQVETNTSDIQDIKSELAETEHFRGYFNTTAEILAITNSKIGDYAYNAQDGFKWVYGTGWTQTAIRVPDQVIPKSNTFPLMNGTAAIGSETAYAAGNHIHPVDTSRASAIDLNTHTANKNNPHTVTKTQVGLGNVDNTSDVNKPISTLTQQALNNKLNVADAYTKVQVDSYLNLKADKNNTYTKTETDSLLNLKADKNNIYTKAESDSLLNNKVDKVSGKVLSSNDYTTTEKTKLNSLSNEWFGTQSQYDALTKDVNTLYFIYQ